LLFNRCLGGVQDEASGGGGLHLRNTGHRSHPLQSMDHLVGFPSSFITEDICHSFEVLIRMVWFQGAAVQEIHSKFGSHGLELLISEGGELVAGFSFGQGSLGGQGKSTFFTQGANFSGADVVASLLAPN